MDLEEAKYGRTDCWTEISRAADSKYKQPLGLMHLLHQA